jgi:hypothetical protein
MSSSKETRSVFDQILQNRREGLLYPHPDDDGGLQFPVLWEFLTRTQVDDETFKEPAKLSVSLGSGGFAVEIVDGALGLMVNTTSETLSGAFQAIERALNSPNIPVRYFKDSEVKLKRKPKKKEETKKGV